MLLIHKFTVDCTIFTLCNLHYKSTISKKLMKSYFVMKEQVNSKLLKDYLVQLDSILINIKYHQLHNKIFILKL